MVISFCVEAQPLARNSQDFEGNRAYQVENKEQVGSYELPNNYLVTISRPAALNYKDGYLPDKIDRRRTNRPPRYFYKRKRADYVLDQDRAALIGGLGYNQPSPMLSNFLTYG